MNKIPEIINAFNVYKDGTKLIGVSAEVTIPDFEAVTETISGAGILGEYDAVNVGQFSAQEIEIPFRVLYGDIYEIFAGNPVNLTLRGSLQVADGNGTRSKVGMRVIVQGTAKKLTSGKVSAGKPMESSITLGLTYIKVEIDGSTAIELDKLNNIFVVNGVDQLADVNSLI